MRCPWCKREAGSGPTLPNGSRAAKRARRRGKVRQVEYLKPSFRKPWISRTQTVCKHHCHKWWRLNDKGAWIAK